MIISRTVAKRMFFFLRKTSLPVFLSMASWVLQQGLARGAEGEGGPDPFYLKLLDEGLGLYRSGSLAEAAECLRIAAFGLLDDEPKLGVCYVYEAAILCQLKAPDQSSKYVGLVNSLKDPNLISATRFPPEVLRAFKAAQDATRTQAASSSPRAAFNPSAPSLPSEDVELEIASLKKRIKADPSNIHNYFDIAAIHMSRRNFKDARDALRNIIKVDPKNGKAYLELGRVEMAENRHLEAATSLVNAAKLIPDEIEVWYLLGISYTQLKDMTEAQVAFNAATRINSNYKDLAPRVSEVGAYLSTQGKKATELYQKAMDEVHPPRRASMLKEAMRYAPKELRILLALSNSYADMGKHEDAAKTIETAISIQPEDGNLYVRAADLWIRAGDEQRALNVIRRGEKIKSAIANVKYEIGIIYYKQKKYKEASVAFRAVLDMDQNYKDARALCTKCAQFLEPKATPK